MDATQALNVFAQLVQGLDTQTGVVSPAQHRILVQALDVLRDAIPNENNTVPMGDIPVVEGVA